jgi:hypothetical protein
MMKKIQNIKNVLFFSMLLIPFAIQSCGDEAEFYGFNPITVSEDHRAPASTVTEPKTDNGSIRTTPGNDKKKSKRKKTVKNTPHQNNPHQSGPGQNPNSTGEQGL